MTEQSAARTVVRQLDTAEVAAAYAVDPVVAREALVQERVARIEQLEHAAILTQHVLEQELRLAAKSRAQVGVEPKVLRQGVVELAQLEPLACKVLDERRGARVCEHAPHLTLERRGLVQRSRRRGLQQLVVGDAAPEEERQARGERKVVDAICRTGGETFGPSLEAIEETRVDQESRDGLLDAGLEPAVLRPALVEAEQRLERGVARIHGPPIRERREPGQDLARARHLVAAAGGEAAEDGAPARRVAGAGRLERPVDLDAVDAAAGGVDAVELVDAFAAAFVEQGDRQRMRSAGHPQTDCGRVVDGERLAVERDVDARRSAEALSRQCAGAARPHADLVSRIERKVVRERETAARSEGQPVDVRRLRAARSVVADLRRTQASGRRRLRG